MAQTARAIIPAAGLGKRLRPITHVFPKEMLPVAWHPAIEWVIAETVQSGYEEIAVIISPGKRIIEHYLTTYCDYLTNRCHLSFLTQFEPFGLGHALSLARDFCAGDRCAVLLPDDLIEAPRLPLLQMASICQEVSGAVVAITKESAANAGRYGGLQLRQVSDRVFKVEGLHPRRTEMGSASVLLGVGRYLLAPDVLDHATALCGQNQIGELDDSIIFQHMLELGEPIYAVLLEGTRYDVSTSDGYMAAWEAFKSKEPG